MKRNEFMKRELNTSQLRAIKTLIENVDLLTTSELLDIIFYAQKEINKRYKDWPQENNGK
jgi:hypothetical protein